MHPIPATGQATVLLTFRLLHQPLCNAVQGRGLLETVALLYAEPGLGNSMSDATMRRKQTGTTKH